MFFTGIVRDISERKQAERELRESESRYRSLVETAEVVIISLDPQHRILQWNHQAEEVYGFERDEIIGKDYFELFLPEEDRDGVAAEIKKNLSGIPTHGYENEIITRQGHRRTLQWDAAGLTDDNGEAYAIVAVGQDVTERNRAMDRAVQAERLAAIGQMMAGLAHESRNAIQRAQACQEMLALDLADQPDLLDLSTRTQQALDDLHRLYEEVRGYSAKIILDLQESDLSDIWMKAWNSLELMRSSRNIQLNTNIDCANLTCQIDRHRIEQVF